MSSEQGCFPDYVAKTNASSVALYIFVAVYTFSSLLIVGPLVVWGRWKDKDRQAFVDDLIFRTNAMGPGQRPPQQDPPLIHDPQRYNAQVNHAATLVTAERLKENEMQGGDSDQTPYQKTVVDAVYQETTSQITSDTRMQRKRNRVQNSAYRDENFDIIRSSGTANGRAQPPLSSSGECSSVPLSAATTSRLYCQASQQSQTCIWDKVGSRRKSRRSVGRSNKIHHAIQTETQLSSARNVLRQSPPVFEERHSIQMQSKKIDQNLSGSHTRLWRPRSRQGSFSSNAGGSILSPVEDDITPNDAADANDPGRVNSFDCLDGEELTVFCGPNALWKPKTILRGIDGVAEFANPDTEMKRILGLSIPLTLGAISNGIFYAITVAIVSHSIGTESMAAFVLSELLMGFSDELIGTIADAESSLCSHSLSMGDMHLTGQYVQLAISLHLIVFVAVIIFWLYCMNTVVEWLVLSSSIADIALSYTRIALFQHLVQTFSRTFTLLFHFVGNENFESQADICEGLGKVFVVAAVVLSKPGVTLEMVGWIQVITAVVALTAKLGYAFSRGWGSSFPKPFWTGLMGSLSFRNKNAIQQLFATSLPLFIGAFLEYSEWELLTCFVAHLGPAEVVSWTLLGVVWKVVEGCTDGIGEASAVRVAYHLGTGNPKKARLSSYKAAFISVVQSLFVTSILYIIGNNLATWLTTDLTLQLIFKNALTIFGLGNIVMSYRMILWSLVGAQDRYRLATLVVLLSKWLVAIPFAAAFVYGLTLDLNGVIASIIVGSETASTALAYVVLRSDWERLSCIMQDTSSSIVDMDSHEECENTESDRR